jgi:DNA-binding LacI/PurR family transcriptional regulator
VNTGLETPRDYMITGFDGITTAEFAGLTTYETPQTRLGQIGAELLLARLKQDNLAPVHRRLEGRLVVRASTSFRTS